MFTIIPFFVLHIKELKQRRLRRQRECQHLCTSITLFCTLLYCCTRLGREDSYLFSRFMDVDARRKLPAVPCKRTQHCWMVHVTFVCTRCCVLFGGCCAKFETFLLFLDRRCACMRVHHTFWYISIPSLHDYDVKMPNFTVYGESKQGTTNFSFWLFLNLSAAPKK